MISMSGGREQVLMKKQHKALWDKGQVPPSTSGGWGQDCGDKGNVKMAVWVPGEEQRERRRERQSFLCAELECQRTGQVARWLRRRAMGIQKRRTSEGQGPAHRAPCRSLLSPTPREPARHGMVLPRGVMCLFSAPAVATNSVDLYNAHLLLFRSKGQNCVTEVKLI